MRSAKITCIPKENAVFWLDKDGFWHNRHGKFEHPRIIAYFHGAIRKDEQGYHLYQQHEQVLEKVYFHYEDTALFVFDIRPDKGFTLILNTRKEAPLVPSALFIRQDNLYVSLESETAKFSERSLLKLSPYLQYDNDRIYLKSDDGPYEIITVD